MFISSCKLFSLLINRKNINTLLDILMKKPCRPLRPNEMKIQYTFDKDIEINTWRYVYLGIATCSFVVSMSLCINLDKRKLTYPAWLPFDYSSTILYSLTFAHQLMCLIIGSFLNIACDSLFCGFLVHICCQIEILTYRLRENISYSDILSECIRQHCYIFRFAFIINTKFRLLVIVQFVISTLVVCFSLYRLTKTTSHAKHVEMTLCMMCMLTQIFFYCWYGNEVKLKSCELSDNIFKMEWITLNKKKKKSLIIIMRRAIMPIQITSAYIISMNLESFMTILKMSYSTYNLLQQI
ncbi:PREDICTED: odorant receptor 4-like [Dinoponera quadriceps]|uniref:Odorant receptor 4-like n=1 Tax=Dinoponera quadriceps TaxID=609295 RepID=A0A6P3XEB5_DINQU|nr:PREDICTED: odorant receptor 4-like [Dinoponera quadriceps]